MSSGAITKRSFKSVGNGVGVGRGAEGVVAGTPGVGADAAGGCPVEICGREGVVVVVDEGSSRPREGRRGDGASIE